MDSEALVHLAMAAQSCNQKGLAALLGVSQTQITKWKKGEHISSEMEMRLRELAGTGTLDPSFVLAAGGLDQANQWKNLISYLADLANENAETGYDTYLLSEEDTRDLLCNLTFSVLERIGLKVPEEFPPLLCPPSTEDDETVWEDHHHAVENYPFANTIRNLFGALTDLYGFYAAYISELFDNDSLDLYSSGMENIEPCLIDLAACKISIDPKFAPSHNDFCRETKDNYLEWLNALKAKAFSAGVPLRAEITDLVYGSTDELSHEAEAESFGFNSSRIHPDIYMNELLVGMRTIHQALPFMLKKMGLEDDFRLDVSELALGRIKLIDDDDS